MNDIKAGVIAAVLKHLSTVSSDMKTALLSTARQLIVRIGSQAISSLDLKLLLRQKEPENEKVPLSTIQTLISMLQEQSQRGSFLEFDMNAGFSSLILSNVAVPQKNASRDVAINERVWPPTNGLSISLWFRIVQYGMDNHPVRLLSLLIPTETEKTLLSLYLDPQDFSLIILTSKATRVTKSCFR